MNTVKKGDQLELDFYNYLCAQQDRGELVYGTHPAELCKIKHKAAYYCHDRGSKVKFDVVIEHYREGSTTPHSYTVFECKNYKGSIPVEDISKFSYDISSVFGHAAKAAMVISTRLQSGADAIARKRNMAIVKYDGNGFEIIAQRNGGLKTEISYLRNQFFRTNYQYKPLKFSSYYNGNFFVSIGSLLRALDTSLPSLKNHASSQNSTSVPYMPPADIEKMAECVLRNAGYQDGEADLKKICSDRSIQLQFSNQTQKDSHGNEILGHANFERKTILVNQHENKHRERFTIAHEIGHFCLNHGRYLRSESIIENDLLKNSEQDFKFNYDRLEIQANKFASYLLMPDTAFKMKVREIRKTLDIKDRGYGIYVDNKPWNYRPYFELISRVSSHFNVSKQASELRLKETNKVTDWRTDGDILSLSDALSSSTRTKN